MAEVGEIIQFDKQQLTRVYRAWAREEIESIELIEAVGKYVEYREPRSAAKAESKAALLSERDELREALKFYADPDTYFAIGFFPDRPSGDFMDDFSEDHGGDYDREMPGKRARAALAGKGVKG